MGLILPLHTFTLSAALSWRFVGVAALAVARNLCAHNLSCIAVTHSAGVLIIGKLGAIRILFTVKHTACKQKIKNMTT